MKKVIYILITSFLLTGCSDVKQNSTDLIDITANTLQTTELPTPLTTSATTTAGTTSEAVLSESPVEEYTVKLSDIDLSDVYSEFDEAKPMRYEIIDEAEIYHIDEEKRAIAEAAVLESEYYAESLSSIRKWFVYENDELKPSTEESIWPIYFEPYVLYDEQNGITAEIKLCEALHTEFDGENTEDLFIFAIPLPESKLEWSGTGVFYVPVYVNSDNGAMILHNAAQQSLWGEYPIRYEDGTVHMLFIKGHTTGTTWSYIYRFSDGKAQLAYDASFIQPADNGYILRENCGCMNRWYKLFFRDAIRDCYCEVGSRKLHDDMISQIKHCPDITEKYPDIADNTIEVIGGRYFTIGGSTDSFEITDGEVASCEDEAAIVSADFAADAEHSTPSIYIDLYKWS